MFTGMQHLPALQGSGKLPHKESDKINLQALVLSPVSFWGVLFVLVFFS